MQVSEAGSPALNVMVLSHCPQQAQGLMRALQEAVEGQAGADPAALHWRAGNHPQMALGSDLCFLMPWDAAGATDLEDLQTHRKLRQALHEQGQSFEALRGEPARLVRQALSALSRWQPVLRPEGAQTFARPGWLSTCDRCGDPDCEYRLFKNSSASGATSHCATERPSDRAPDQPDQ